MDPKRSPGGQVQLESLGYIASASYSGSTLLDLVLGSNDGVTSLGEVLKIADYFRGKIAGFLGNRVCSCRQKLHECEFWEAVREELARVTGNGDFSFEEFPLYVENERATIHRKLPTLAESLLLLGSKKTWDLFARFSGEIQRFDTPSKNAFDLFEAVARVHRTAVIVDSSKHAFQLKVLYLTDPERFKLIYLFRDGRGVALSRMIKTKCSFEAAARHWVRQNRNLMLMMKSIPRASIHRVRYEDVCSRTDETVGGIMRFLGVNTSLDFEGFKLKKTESHGIGGNPMRKRTDENGISLDEKWRRTLSPEQLQAFDRIGGDLNRKLGYS